MMASRAMVSHNGPPGKPAAFAGTPNQTYSSNFKNTASHRVANQSFSLYCTNLPEKLQKADLRLSLYTLFSTYGPVLDVVAVKNSKMRGQAHVVYRDTQASTQAMRALQGFDFFGKEMVSRNASYMMFKVAKSAIENSICKRKIRHHREARRHISHAGSC